MKEIIAYIGDILGSLIIRIRIPKAPTPHSNALFAPLSDKNLPEKKTIKNRKLPHQLTFFLYLNYILVSVVAAML